VDGAALRMKLVADLHPTAIPLGWLRLVLQSLGRVV
jgi:hypothetical protein